MNLKNKKQKRWSTLFLALLLCFSMVISGCGGAGGNGDGSTAADGSIETSTADGSKEAQASGESTEGQTGEELPEVSLLTANMGAVFSDFVATKENFSGQTFELSLKAPGGMLPPVEIQKPEIYSKEKIAEVNRTMRAYEKQVDSLIVNDAEEFYVYGLLTKEEQAMYDAYYMLAQDPTTQDNIVSFQTAQDIQTESFGTDLYMALLALCYDHPELWWMYPWNGTAEIGWGVGDTVNGKTTIYTGFTKTYPNFEKDVKAFNEAVEDFLLDIDASADDEEIALQIHDKLIEMVTYDNDILKEGKNDFGHTAFGPFVTNSSGTPHYCVCDGYSQAYLYALQQMGITGTVVVGMAGNAGVDGGMGLHAWNLVRLGGIWYEVDSTWDDYSDYANDVKQYYAEGSTEYKYCMEAATDKIYMNYVMHNMYHITTAEIQKFEPGPNLYYTSRDGKMRFTIVGASERWRVCDDKDMGTNFEGAYTKLLPIADGKLTQDKKQGQDDKQGKDDKQGQDNKQDGNDAQGNEDGPEDEDEVWDGGNGDISDLIKKDSYKAIAGTYYVSAFNGFGEAILKQYYGNDYYKQLSMFELKANGDGVLYENGTTMDFHFLFDGSYLYMYSDNGGMIFLVYQMGNFIMYDYYGNIYTFSKLSK